MYHTASATELTPVLVEPNGSGGADVWLRTNIETREEETDDGTQTIWEADEIHGTVGWVPTAQEVEEDLDQWIETFERAAMTVPERIEEIYAMAERAQAQADFTAILTDTEVGE